MFVHRRRVFVAAANVPQPHFVPGKHIAAFSNKAVAVAKDADVDRHFISHELAFPLEPPHGDMGAAQDIWTRSRNNPDKLVEAIEAWDKEGNEVTREVINTLLVKLCARQHFREGFSLMSWVMEEAPYKITESDRFLWLHLASVHDKASAIFDQLAEKTPRAYESLLTTYVNRNKMEKSETLFKQMKEDKMVTTAGPYDLMLRLYLGLNDHERARDILSEFEKSGVPATSFTYKTLDEYREFFEVKDLDKKITTFLDGLNNSRLKGRDWKNCILLYGAVGKEQEVQRLWDEMKQEGFIPDSYYLAAAEAFGKAGNMTRFEQLCEELASRNGGIQENLCNVILKVYSDKGLMENAEEIFKQVLEACDDSNFESYHCRVESYLLRFRSYHFLVAGYMKQKNWAKALEKFHESLEKGGNRQPLYFTMLLAMEAYAKTRDVKGAEKFMARLSTSISKISKSESRVDVRLFNSLLRVYAAAKKPVFGIEERMWAAKVSPNAETKKMLSKVKVLV